MTLVFVKRRAELGSKKRFLFLRLSGETEENHDKAQDGAVLADGQGGTTHGKKNSSVNRMPDMGVWARADQLMVLLDLHLGAPIFPNRGASPNGEHDSGKRNPRSRPADPLIRGNESVIEKIQNGRRKIVNQKKANYHVGNVGKPRADRFRF